MTSLEPAVSASQSRPALSIGPRYAPALYAATLFVSALLLFAVQPMFTKMVLPKLGGAPSVWSVAMVFFQVALLAGYAYAHLLARSLAPSHAALVHLVFLGIAAVTLPIGVASGFAAPPLHAIEMWLIALFAASIGLPFVALSASAPLLQSWFAVSGHKQAKNPYVLYAASNLGSFAALVLYPFLLEPTLSLHAQAQVWSVGFAMLGALVASAGLVIVRVDTVPTITRSKIAAPTLVERVAWTALAAIPSGLVIAVTAHITTDIAAAPFLWVIPLALYLLTFVALFRERPWITHTTTTWLVPFIAAIMSISVLGGDKTFWLANIALNLVGFFVLALLCHGELYARRPAPARLTEFYLWTSLGGVIGGVFAGLIAPNVFNNTWEYPILIAAAVLAMPGTFKGGIRGFLREAGWLLAIAAPLAAAGLLVTERLSIVAGLPFQLWLIALAGLMIWMRNRPARLFALVVLAFVTTGFWQPGLKRIETARSFFGVHKVVETVDGTHRLLFHGTTIHGAARVRNTDGTPFVVQPEPISYYYPGGPFSDAVALARAAQGGLRHVAVVGLGTGTLACYKNAGEDWAFFEIDPEVVRIARDPQLFRFISECAPDAPIVLGDARLTLTASQLHFNLIVLDAFSSDSIPVHLLTTEGFAGYLSRLDPHGVIVVHISNRHMELARVVSAVALTLGLVAFIKQDETAKDFLVDYKANALIAVLARSEFDLGDLPRKSGWRRIDPAGIAAWTDDYSNILDAIWRKKLAD
jgi:hypothetical protein